MLLLHRRRSWRQGRSYGGRYCLIQHTPTVLETFVVWKETTSLLTVKFCRDKPWISIRPQANSLQRVTGQIWLHIFTNIRLFMFFFYDRHKNIPAFHVEVWRKHLSHLCVCDRRKITTVNTGSLKTFDILSQANNFSNAGWSGLIFWQNEWKPIKIL